jgi:hypothetical protein
MWAGVAMVAAGGLLAVGVQVLTVWLLLLVVGRLGLAGRAADPAPEPAAELDHPGDVPADPAPAAGGQGPGPWGLRSGPCHACGRPHIGLSPACVVRAGDGFEIPDGTPGVCPRCWVDMHPRDATNVLTAEELSRMAASVGSVATGRDSSPAPEPPPAAAGIVEDGPPVHYDAPLELDPDAAPLGEPSNPRSVALGGDATPPAEPTDAELERLTAPDIRCAACGGTGSRQFHPLHKDGKETGQFWCQACVDSLGGPRPAKRRKRRRDE